MLLELAYLATICKYNPSRRWISVTNWTIFNFMLQVTHFRTLPNLYLQYRIRFSHNFNTKHNLSCGTIRLQ